jgi:probable HAF family extracellular repeat protein
MMRAFTAISPLPGRSLRHQRGNPFHTSTVKLRTAIQPVILGALLVALSPAALADSILAYNVNINGLIVGVDTIGSTQQGFVYNPATGATTFIGPPGSTDSQAVGINNNGQIVGVYTTTAGEFGFLYNPGTGTYTTINVPGSLQYPPVTQILLDGGTVASGINNSGEIVGDWTNSSGQVGAFTYSAGTYDTSTIADNSEGLSYTDLYGINDSGLISGFTVNVASGNVRTYNSFLYDGTFTQISFPGASSTVIQGLNDSGVAVGFYTENGVTSGFIYNDGTYTSIMYPGASTTDLFGISDNGELVGSYSCTSGLCPLSDPAFFAIPTGNGYSFTTIQTLTPEPGSMILLGSGILAMLAVARRRVQSRN